MTMFQKHGSGNGEHDNDRLKGASLIRVKRVSCQKLLLTFTSEGLGFAILIGVDVLIH